jgi:uncharacterized protein (DUF2384 family)
MTTAPSPSRPKADKAKPAKKGHYVLADRSGNTPKFVEFRRALRSARMEERILIERNGVPYLIVKTLLDETGLSATDFQRTVKMPKATFSKKMKERSTFSGSTGHSVVGLLELINKVEDILATQVDNPEAKGFDVERWVGDWIQQPQPALGGIAPAEIMDTPTGRASVMRVLGSIQSGSYQ